MIAITPLLILLLTFSTVCAEDLTTIDDKTYKGITVSEIHPCKIRILHSSGAASIPTGYLTDEFIQKHSIPVDKCPSFESERHAANELHEFHLFKNKKLKFILPDGRSCNTTQIVNYNPVKIVVILEGGPRTYECSSMPDFIRMAIHYSEDAAKEYRIIELQAQQQYKARQKILRKKIAAARAKSERAKYERISRSLTKSRVSNNTGFGRVWVRGYYRKDGTHVRGHYRVR